MRIVLGILGLLIVLAVFVAIGGPCEPQPDCLDQPPWWGNR